MSDVTNFPNGVNAGALLIADVIQSGGGLSLVPQTLTTSGAIDEGQSVVFLNRTSPAIAATKSAPVPGELFIVVNTSASGTAAHTVTLPTGVTWDGTNRVATLDAPGEALVCIAISATRYQVLVNLGGVAFS
jgi:hypothetical protein